MRLPYFTHKFCMHILNNELIHKGVKIVIIHVVQPGETLNTIAEQYGVTPERLIIDNELPNPENLVVGQSMIVRIHGGIRYNRRYTCQYCFKL